MDPVLIVQVIINLIVIGSAENENKAIARGLLLLLFISWFAPIFILGLFKAILVWMLSMFVTVVILGIKEKISKLS